MKQIGSEIKNIRIKNNLTQSQFADILGVTFQAVSKWENNKSIPDIDILKEISNKFNVDLNYLINGNKKKHKFLILGVIIFLLIIVSLTILYIFHKDKYEFKTLVGKTNDISVQGSVTYDKNTSSIYLNVDYNDDDNSKYNYIKCILYEKHNDILNVISEKIYDDNKKVLLKDYLKTLSFVISDYSPSCKYYKNSTLYLEISANIDNGKSVTYKVPIVFENC